MWAEVPAAAAGDQGLRTPSAVACAPFVQATPYYVESEDAEAELEAGAAAAGAGDGGHTMGSSSGSSSSEASSSDEEREDARGRESQDRAVARGVDATAPAPGGEEGLQGSDSSEAAAAAGEAEESQLVGQGAVVPLPPLCVEVPEPPALKRQKAEPVAAVAT